MAAIAGGESGGLIQPARVVVTGSEATGKTTLAAILAADFRAPWSSEEARHYLDRVARPLGADDVEPIARGQIAGEDRAIAAAGELVLHDTDLLSTMVYARHYYGACPEWIEQAVERRLADLYLLCHPDVPWIADGLYHDRGFRRDEMHALFVAALSEAGARVVHIRGDWTARQGIARRAVEGLLGVQPAAS